MNTRAWLLGALWLTGCATVAPPSIPVTHPASPEAVEGSGTPRNSLAPDEATQRTSKLLESPASSPTPAPMDSTDSMKSMPGM